MSDSHDRGSTRKGKRERHRPTKFDHIYYSVHADGTKVYEVRLPHGNRIPQVVGPNLEDAKARANALYAPNAPRVKKQNTTFAEVVADWRETRTVRPSSVKRYDGILNKYVLPKFGRTKVRDIDAGTIQRILNGVPAGSQKLAYSTVRTVLKHGVEMGVLAAVPKLSRKNTPKAPPSRKRILSPDEEARLLAYAAPRGCLSLVIRVAVGEALRKGEAVGLEWQDVDFTGGKLHVRRSVDKDGRVGPCKGQKDEDFDRNKGALIPLTPMAKKALLELRADSDGTGRVFRNRYGNPWAYSDIDRAFRAAVKAAALEETEDGKVTFHSLRHTGISRLANHPAIPLVHVRDFARHTDLTTTQGYVHKIESEKIAAAFDEALAA